MESALYVGKVFHQRFVPKRHAFNYRIFLFWLDLDEIELLDKTVRGFSHRPWSLVRFKREDYLGDTTSSLTDSVVHRMSELAGKPLHGKVFMLGQVRIFGLYFSPVNFFYLLGEDGTFSHMLAEVSNTPWNQRHHYLVDLNNQIDCDKAFHVSPFNPIDMQYHWQVNQPDQRLDLSLGCSQGEKHFEASLNLQKQQLNSKTLSRVLMSIPSMTIKTVAGIYWQAFKLFLKGVPYYGHPISKDESKK